MNGTGKYRKVKDFYVFALKKDRKGFWPAGRPGYFVTVDSHSFILSKNSAGRWYATHCLTGLGVAGEYKTRSGCMKSLTSVFRNTEASGKLNESVKRFIDTYGAAPSPFWE